MVNFETPKEQVEASMPKASVNEVESLESTSHEEEFKEMTEEEFRAITNQIRELETQVRIWRKKREELNSQVIEKTKIRNQKNEEVRGLIKEANEHKALRDDFNAKISELKSQKQIIDIELKETEKIHDQAENKLEPIEIPKNMNSQLKRYQKELKDLEWKLQTQSFSIEDERRLVDRIADLDQKIEGLAEFKSLSHDRIKSYHTLRKLRNQMYKIIREMNGYVKESRHHHKSMVELFSKANGIRKEADSIHADIQKVKTQADLIHSEFVEKIKLKRSLTNKIKHYSQKIQTEQRNRETRAMKEKSTNVLQKTKDGKKISFDDFKSLIDLGLI